MTAAAPTEMRGVRLRRTALALAAVTLLAVLLAAAPAAHGQEGEVEVRVAAQRLADGRTEFALQERRADGSWAARRLPRARFFPANATVGRWLASSPLTVELSSDSMSAATGNASLEVRVAAQLLADGRMEFALQERNPDGSWAARRLPRARFFPASPRVGRWLASSPLTVNPTGWASVTVEITAVCNWPGAATSLQIDECRASEAAGLDPSERWIVWHHPPAKRADGTTIWDRAQYRFDGGVSGSSSGLKTVFENLADGSHTVEMRVLNGSAWSEWSMPYAFTIRRAAAAGPPASVTCTAEAVATRVSGSIAQVIAGRSRGTAFYIGDSEWLTAEHVLNGATSVRLRNATLDVTARVVGQRADVDLAVLSAGSSEPALRWGEPPGVGGSALVLGYGVGQHSPTAGMTQGIVSELYTEGGHSYVRTDAPANPGNSGGPLLDHCGNVIGVIQSKVADVAVEGVAYALGADSVRALLPSVRTGSSTASAAPTTLEITAFCNASLDEGGWETSAACRAAAAGGLSPSQGWSIWVTGVEDWDNARYSIDGTAGVAEADLTLEGLAPGTHTIQIIERQAAGWTAWSEPYGFTIRSSSNPSVTETITIVDDLGGGSVLIRRQDRSYWIIDYIGDCSHVSLSTAAAELRFTGTESVALVVRWLSQTQQCSVVSSDSRIDRVTASPTGRFGDSLAVLTRASGELWVVEYGAGCLSLSLRTVTAYVRSPGLFAGVGSEIIIAEPYSQRCLIWDSEEL